MTEALRDLLDDAADVAVRDRWIDAGTVLARSGRRRARLRSTGSLLMLGAAAAIAAAVAVTLGAVPALLAPVTPAQSSTQVGLPDRWYFTPSFAPPVTRRHMPAASMLLGGDGNDPVLVSADSKTYARLPWGPDDAMAALSADGTRVAWATQGQKQSTVHLLRTATGEQLDAKLPAGSGFVTQTVWAGGQAYLTTERGQVVRVGQAAGGRAAAVTVCGCTPVLLGADGSGRLVQSADHGVGAGMPAVATVPTGGMTDWEPIADSPSWSRWQASAAHPAWSYESSRVLAVNPAGISTVSLSYGTAEGGQTEWSLVFPSTKAGRDEFAPIARTERITAGLPITDVDILAWTGAGIVLRIETLDAPAGRRAVSLRLVDPAGTGSSLLSSRLEGAAVPMAIASGLVGDGKPIESQPPDFPSWDRGRVQYALQQLWRSNYPYWQLIAVGALAAITALVVLRRRQRRLP